MCGKTNRVKSTRNIRQSRRCRIAVGIVNNCRSYKRASGEKKKTNKKTASGGTKNKKGRNSIYAKNDKIVRYNIRAHVSVLPAGVFFVKGFFFFY